MVNVLLGVPREPWLDNLPQSVTISFERDDTKWTGQLQLSSSGTDSNQELWYFYRGDVPYPLALGEHSYLIRTMIDSCHFTFDISKSDKGYHHCRDHFFIVHNRSAISVYGFIHPTSEKTEQLQKQQRPVPMVGRGYLCVELITSEPST